MVWNKNKVVKHKKTALIPVQPRVDHFSNIASGNLKLPKKFRAAVGYDNEGKPSLFLFDLIAFWELICRIDEKLFEKLPDNEYESVSLGTMIDTLEERWPFSPAYKAHMKREYDRALQEIKEGRVHAL